MNSVICPMLAALKPVDRDGQPVNRECITHECRFFNAEQNDCNLSLGNRAVAILAEDAVSRPGPNDIKAMIAGSIKPALDGVVALEGRADQVNTTVENIGSKLSEVVETQLKTADRLLEQLSLLQANLGKIEQSAGGVDARMTRIEESLAAIDARLTGTEQSHRTVLQALETRQQREQAELDQRKNDESIACNNRGVALYYRGAHEAARQAFEKALELSPEYAEALNNLGLTLSRLGKEAAAIEAFKKALTVDPGMGEAYNNLGFLYHTTSQFDRAAQMFGMATENAADSSIAYTNLGNSFYAMQKPDKAVEAWRRAVDLDPLNENAQRGLRMFAQEVSNN